MTRKLSIELVPKTSWYSNVRSILKSNEWDLLRKSCYEKAGNVCEICGDIGTNQNHRHKVECHEIWDYNEKTRVQKLTGFISLCPNCHTVKHAGLAFIQNKQDLVYKQLVKVNGYETSDAHQDLKEAFDTFRERSQYSWYTDMEYLINFLSKNGIDIDINKTLR